MIAVHHSLAIALARMLDETGLTGQTTFRAEFDLTGEQRNSYPALPNLSGHSARLKRALSKVSFPQATMDEARALMEDYESELPLDRQIEIMATSPAQKEAETIAIAGAMLDKRRDDDQDEDEDEDAEVMSFAGGERLWDVADPIADVLKQRVTELPGCQRMSIRYDLPIRS